MITLGLNAVAVDASLQKVLDELNDYMTAVSPRGRKVLLSKIGKEKASRVPGEFAKNAGHWRSPRKWPRGFRTGGKALLDRGGLAKSVVFHADANTLYVSSSAKQAVALQEGLVITPKGQWLLLWMSPPLSEEQVRNPPVGKDAIRATYPGSFFAGGRKPGSKRKAFEKDKSRHRSLENWFEGPGIYWRPKGKQLRRIAAAARKVKMPAFNWLRWYPQDISWIKNMADEHLSKKLIRRMSGFPDLGDTQ